ncbi:hypothetical protein CAPTEDRAFT_189750 [Capitella teleta]|uniref:Uncharacterized protein n=1 Tax=Capitella teleta TaxID=283909 RepID=R7UAF4_CAPTE|nr:hypothetical protein CAPTEDRAFT_189750 [Capitella teleta]|eukprot:ELU00126.1 hypothetical protein CAPTEDRAFT_189750 [Capitella teleta]
METASEERDSTPDGPGLQQGRDESKAKTSSQKEDSGESKDYTKLIKCLEESVTPSTHYIEDCVNYFFCKQGDMSIRQYQSEPERLIERMIPAYYATSTITHLDLKKFLLRNLLLVGKNVLKDCQKLQQRDCTVESIIDLALQAEFRETTNARISKTINSSHQSKYRGFPDHFPVFIETVFDKLSSKRIDPVALKTAISHSHLADMNSDLPLEKQVWLYDSVLGAILNEMAPLKTKTITSRTDAEWSNEQIREAKQGRRRAERRWRGSQLQVDKEIFIEHHHKVL